MGKFIIGIVVGVILVAVAVFVYFTTGMAPVATSSQAMPFEKMLAQKALEARVEKEMPKTVPIPANEETFAAGAKVYDGNCAVCHGLPDQPATPISKGMFPKPPHLFMGKGVTDDPPGETYWKVKNGIRLTGMPAFGPSLSDTQIWQVSLLLANADKIGPNVKQLLVPEVLSVGGSEGGSNPPANAPPPKSQPKK
ncbi:MAG TPA: cytochrome c [Terriglobales bacterium]|nr:cytochrome c [Terriglobales bacterium]